MNKKTQNNNDKKAPMSSENTQVIIKDMLDLFRIHKLRTTEIAQSIVNFVVIFSDQLSEIGMGEFISESGEKSRFAEMILKEIPAAIEFQNESSSEENENDK